MIYLDHWFWGLTEKSCFYVGKTDVIPTGCLLAGRVYYQFNKDHIVTELNELSNRCEKILVIINEPVEDLRSIICETDHGKTLFFADVVPNYHEPRLLTDISWFVVPENYYVSKIWAQKLLQMLDHRFDKPKKFDCLLGTARSHRDRVSSLYENSPHKNEIIYTYFRTNPSGGIWDYPIGDIPVTAAMIDYKGHDVRASAVLPISIYNQSYYSIVSETTALHEQSQFTEKVAKPMLAMRPFVAFCGPFYLRNLRSLGFQTFDTVIDESYDTIIDDDKRYKNAWAQVENLCRQDPMAVFGRLRLILEHNQKHFLQTDWHANVRKFLNQ